MNLQLGTVFCQHPRYRWLLTALLTFVGGALLIALQAGCNHAGGTPPWLHRGGHVGSSSDLSMLGAMASNGMNAVHVSMGGHLVGTDGKPVERLANAPGHQTLLDQWQRETEALGLQFWPMMELFGTDDRKRWPLDTRWYVDLEGKEYRHTPCPNDPALWQRKLTPVLVEIARWAASKPNVPGILIDFEMYGADRSAYLGACFCPHCKQEIARALGKEIAQMDLSSAAGLKQYQDAATRTVTRFAEQSQRQVHTVNPGCHLGGYVLDVLYGDGSTAPFYKGVIRGWGTAELPVLLFSEATYEHGYRTCLNQEGKVFQGDRPGYLDAFRRKLSEWGAHAEFVPGIWIQRIPPENLAENLYQMAKNTRGYWIYDMLAFSVQTPTALPDQGAAAYWNAIRLADTELNRWLESTREYESPLTLRPFTLPAPGVALDQWQKVNLPPGQGPIQPADLLFLQNDQMFYLPARSGEQVTFTVNVDSAHPTKKKIDAVAIVIVDSNGQVIMRDKMTIQDLDEKPGPTGRYRGKRPITFQANTEGTYCVILKGVRYAYGLGASSHPWLASLQPGAHLFRPATFYIKTSAGTDVVRLQLGNHIQPRVFDAAGGLVRADIETKPDGTHVLTIPLTRKASQVLTFTFENPPWDFHIISFTGLSPWLAATPTARFPE